MNTNTPKSHSFRPALRLFVCGMMLLGVAFWMVGYVSEVQTRRNHPGIFRGRHLIEDHNIQLEYAKELKGTGVMLLVLGPVVGFFGTRLLRQRPIDVPVLPIRD